MWPPDHTWWETQQTKGKGKGIKPTRVPMGVGIYLQDLNHQRPSHKVYAGKSAGKGVWGKSSSSTAVIQDWKSPAKVQAAMKLASSWAPAPSGEVVDTMDVQCDGDGNRRGRKKNAFDRRQQQLRSDTRKAASGEVDQVVDSRAAANKLQKHANRSGQHCLPEQNEDGREEIGSDFYSGELMKRITRKNSKLFCWIKPQDPWNFPASVEAKLKEMSEVQRAQAEERGSTNFFNEGAIYLRTKDQIEGVWLNTGMNVCFKIYIDNEGVGAYEVQEA